MKQIIMKINTTDDIFEFATMQDADAFFEIVEIGTRPTWHAWDKLERVGYKMMARRDDDMLVWQLPETKLEDLEIRLRKHDWYYMFSDDNRVYLAGEDSLDTIKRAVKELGAEGEALYNKYKKG